MKKTQLVILLVVVAVVLFAVDVILPRVKCNIEIEGKGGLLTNNIYIKSNTTDINGFYDVWRLQYDPSDYFFEHNDFNTLSKIQKRCQMVGRMKPDSNSLIYTDWGVLPLYDYIYVVSQDDGDFSFTVQFK